MGRTPCCNVEGLRKGAWTPDEDQKLLSYIQQYGEGGWRFLPQKAGLLRCGKSCRLRWANYLRPDIKRGEFSPEEEQTIIKLHAVLGNRWSAIAKNVPRRTDNEIKNYWNTRLKKRLVEKGSVHHDHHPNNLMSCPTSSAATTTTTMVNNNPSDEETKPRRSNISTTTTTTSAQLLLNELAGSNKIKSSNCLASILSRQSGGGGAGGSGGGGGDDKKAIVSKSVRVLNKVATTYLKPNKSYVSLVDAVKKVLSKSSQDSCEKINVIAKSSPENSNYSISIPDFEIGNNSSDHSPKSENGQESRCVHSATSPRVDALNKMASKLAFVKRRRPTLLSSTEWRVGHVSSESIKSHDAAGSTKLPVFQSSDEMCLLQDKYMGSIFDPKEVLFEGIASVTDEFDTSTIGVVGDDHDDQLMRSLFSNFGDDLIIGEPIEFNGVYSTSNSSYNGCSDVEERMDDLEATNHWDL